MFLFIVLIRYFESEFNDIFIQREWESLLDYTGIDFSECSASTIDSYNICLKVEKSKPTSSLQLQLEHNISNDKPLWLHFTFKRNHHDFQYIGDGNLFLSGEKDGNIKFLTGVVFKTGNFIYLDVNTRKEAVPIQLNFGLTHTFDCIITNQNQFTIYIDGIHHLSINETNPINIDSVSLKLYSQAAIYELGHIIIGDDPDEMIPAMIDQTLIYRKLEREKYRQNLIKAKALKLFNYTYKIRIPQEYVQYADKHEDVDPRNFQFPYLIGYNGNDSFEEY